MDHDGRDGEDHAEDGEEGGSDGPVQDLLRDVHLFEDGAGHQDAEGRSEHRHSREEGDYEQLRLGPLFKGNREREREGDRKKVSRSDGIAVLPLSPILLLRSFLRVTAVVFPGLTGTV